MKRRQGFVLVCVMWVVAILTVVTIGFGNRAMLDRRASAYTLDQEQAVLMARAAVERGIIEVRNKAFMDALNIENTKTMTSLGQEWAKPMDLLKDTDYFETGEDFKNDTAMFVIEDEERYIDINTAPQEILENVESLSRSAVRKIWVRRTKGDHDGEGAAPFQAPEELRYMRGVDDKDWFGTKRKSGLRNLITTVGDGKINVNTASAEVLACVKGLKGDEINEIMKYRAGDDRELGTSDDQGFGDFQELSDLTGIKGDPLVNLGMYCKVNSSFFKISGIATRRNGTVRALCSAVVKINGNSANVISWREETVGS